VDGLTYLRLSVILELLLFPAFLLVPWVWLKLVLVGLLGFFNSGWYAILKGRLYSTLPGKSGTVMALDNVTGLVGGLLPFGIGLAAATDDGIDADGRSGEVRPPPVDHQPAGGFKSMADLSTRLRESGRPGGPGAWPGICAG
jgi:hypothetical protein